MKERAMPKKVFAGFALLLLVLLTNAALAAYNVAVLRTVGARQDRAHAALLEIEGLLSALKDAETGQRGYLLTGEDDYLGPYRLATQDASHSVSQRMLRLREALADRTDQTPRLDEIERLTTSKLE